MTTVSSADQRFRCDRLRVTLSVEACAARWRRVSAGDLQCSRCSGCPIGAAHAGVSAAVESISGHNLCGSAHLPHIGVSPISADPLSGAPLSVLPDTVVGAVAGVSRRRVHRRRVAAGLPSHSVYWHRMRAAVEAADLRTARRMAQEARDAALWADAGLVLPGAATLNPAALWAVFATSRQAAADAAGVRVAPLAAPVLQLVEPDRVEWAQHPVGLLPDALVAAVVDRSRRQVTRKAAVAWPDVVARVWRAAGLRRRADVAWLVDAARRVRAWALDWCPTAPVRAAEQLALGLDDPLILDQTPPADPVSLAHYYIGLVAHCRRALSEET